MKVPSSCRRRPSDDSAINCAGDNFQTATQPGYFRGIDTPPPLWYRKHVCFSLCEFLKNQELRIWRRRPLRNTCFAFLSTMLAHVTPLSINQVCDSTTTTERLSIFDKNLEQVLSHSPESCSLCDSLVMLACI